MKTFSNYDSARSLGGWASNCRRSIYYPIPMAAVDEEVATEHGFRPHRSVASPTKFALVITIRTKGFNGVAAKVYLSVWAK